MTIDDLIDLHERLTLLLSDNDVAITGGAVRDTLLERPVKDIDIMIQVRPGEDVHGLISHVLEGLHADGILQSGTAGSYAVRGTLSPDYEDERGTFEGSFIPRDPNLRFHGYPLNFILVNDLQKHFDTFPDSISMVGIFQSDTQPSHLVKSPAFLDSVARKRITVYNDVGDRPARLSAKYFPEYAIDWSPAVSGGALE